MGHLIRAGQQDLMTKITINDNDVTVLKPPYKRVGRPKKNWISETLKLAWNRIRVPIGQINIEYDETNEEHNRLIKAVAQLRRAHHCDVPLGRVSAHTGTGGG